MRNVVRLTEIDFFRGIAILLMVVFHTVFDLAFFYGRPINYLDGFWYFQGKSSAVLFMFLSGLSTSFSYNPVRRGLSVLGAGLLITIITYIYMPDLYIRFGILHLLSIGMLTAPLFNRLNALWLMITGTSFIALGWELSHMTTANAGLIPFGLRPPGFTSLDYYPILPWLGFVIYGMAAGKILYPRKQPLWPSAAGITFVRWLSWLGRRSLFVYLMHQPVILTVLYIGFSLSG